MPSNFPSAFFMLVYVNFVSAQDFSDNFLTEIKKMLRFLYHVLSHLYYAHFYRIRQLDLHGYLNIIFKHFIFFVRESNLLERRETSSLDDLVNMMGMFALDTHSEGRTTSPSLQVSDLSSPISLSSSSAQNLNSQAPQTVNMSRGNGSTPPSFNALQNWSAST